MSRLLTKADRLASQKAQFDSLIKNGYVQETYKGLNIFVHHAEGQKPLMKIFRDTCSNAMSFYSYQTMQQLEEAKQRAKESYDRSAAYKAERKENTTLSTPANCAKAIREELKASFPGIKFSVTSSSYSMGDNVRIEWADGPSENIIRDLTCKYQYGNFNGMEDMYEITNNRDDIPQTKYVQPSRSKSEGLRNAVMPALETIYQGADIMSHDIENMLYRIFAKQSFPADAVFTGIERTEQTCGLAEDLYRITYTSEQEAVAVPQKAARIEKTEVPTGEVQIIDYSEKAVAVIGDTKPIKEKLAQLGGKFNGRLTCGPGWIFSKKKLDTLKLAFA